MVATFKRCWFQYSLKTMLLMMTLASVALAWLAYERNEVQKREATIAAIQECDGYIIWSQSRSFRPAWMEPLLGDRLYSDSEVEGVVFVGDRVTDPDLSHLAGLTELKVLSLGNTGITDAGLAHLAHLTTLEEIYLQHTQVTDAGLAHLAGLTKLSQLNISGSQVTKQGINELQKTLPNLRVKR